MLHLSHKFTVKHDYGCTIYTTVWYVRPYFAGCVKGTRNIAFVFQANGPWAMETPLLFDIRVRATTTTNQRGPHQRHKQESEGRGGAMRPGG